MPDPFDGYEYASHLWRRWRLAATVIAVAVVVSLALSLLLPKKYTARATLIIEPPAGSDPRASTAISPIYLESLKTYEHFASSDQLFAQAVERFHLRGGAFSRSLESLKRSVLEVEIPRNTKILQIGVTLGDPQKAHEVARYLAAETVQLDRRINRAGDEEMIEDANRAVDLAAQRLKYLDAARLRAREQLQKAEAARNRVRESGDSRKAELQRLESEYDAAWMAHEEMQNRVRGLQVSLGYRGERLTLVDPGVPPERPSFPNLPLNLVVAAALGLIVSLFYLTVEYSLESRKAEDLRRGLRVTSNR